MRTRPLHAGIPLAGLLALLTACSDSGPVVDPEISYLTDAQRLELFDLERADYLLGIALRPFHAAIATGDEAGIRAAVAEDFSGRLATPPTASQRSVGEESFVGGPLGLEDAAGVDELVRWTASLGEVFSEIETVKLARYQNSSEIVQGTDAIATSRGAFRIAGTSVEGGPLELSGTFTLEHSGFPRFAEDLAIEDQRVEVEHWIHRLELEEPVFAASRALLFEEVTERTGIDTELLHDNWVDGDPMLIFTGGAFLGDVNRDGHLDLLVSEILRPQLFMDEVPSTSRLYFGKGDGTFEDSGWRPVPPHVRFKKNGAIRPFEPYAAIFDATGNGNVDVLHGGKLFRWNAKRQEMLPIKGATPLPNADATLCDYDRDGLVDLYFANSGGQAPEDQRREHVWFDDDRVNGRENELYRNLGGGKFENVTESAGASPAFGRTFASTFFYANDDDWPDLFGANEFGRNVFLVNNGDGTFREIDDVDDVFGGFSMGLTSGDMDGDGSADLYVSNMYSKAGQRVYSHLDLDIYPEDARRMFLASVTGNRLYRSSGDLSFENTTAYAGGYAVGWGFSGAMFDVDLDGWLDLYAPCGYISVDADKPDG